MKFDSFYVIDDNGHKRKIDFITKNKRNYIKKKLKKPKQPEFIIGEVGSGMNFGLKSQMIHSMIHSGRPVHTTFHANSTLGSKEIQDLIELFNQHIAKVPKNKRLNHNRMLKYRSKRLRKMKVKSKDISTTTIRNLKKYLSPYGNFTIKSEDYIFDETRVILDTHSENVFKHLYLLDSVSGTYINIADYVAINMMGGGTEICIDGKQFVFFNDSIGDYELAVEKGNYNRLYIADMIRI